LKLRKHSIRKTYGILIKSPTLNSITPWNRSIQPPLGLLYLALSLNTLNNKILIYDFNLARQFENNIIGIIKRFKPDILGLSLKTVNFHDGLKISCIAKEINPNIITIVGGPHITTSMMNENNYHFQLTLMEMNKNKADIGVIGEGEETFKELAAVTSYSNKKELEEIKGIIFRSGNKWVKTEDRPLIQDIDNIPFPDYSFLPYHWTYDSYLMITSRGCPSKCSFCDARVIWGGVYRQRTAENILAEINFHTHTLKKSKEFLISFTDDTFMVDQKRVAEICEGILKNNYKINWQCEARAVDTQNLNLLKLMRKAGCKSVFLGLESGDANTYKKVLKPNSFDLVLKAVNNIKESGMAVVGSFIIDFPWDNNKTIRETIKFAKSLELDSISCAFATPFPGTDFFNKYDHNQKIYRYYSDDLYKNYDIGIPKFLNDELTLNNLLNYQKELYFSVKNSFIPLKRKNISKGNLENYFSSSCLINRR
jgi:anaerobic magnesium-protoporphyrin IX monomethyl ester cyclase